MATTNVILAKYFTIAFVPDFFTVFKFSSMPRARITAAFIIPLTVPMDAVSRQIRNKPRTQDLKWNFFVFIFSFLSSELKFVGSSFSCRDQIPESFYLLKILCKLSHLSLKLDRLHHLNLALFE